VAHITDAADHVAQHDDAHIHRKKERERL
jgi:hypothetical protein